jgi:hypothetical protein
MKIHTYSLKAFLTLREGAGLTGNTAYEVDGQYAFSPDGEGVYWYDTEDELLENH